MLGGQVTVAIIVAVMFIIFFKIIGLPLCSYAGCYCWYFKSGSLFGQLLSHASCPSIGLDCWASHALKVVIVFIVEQTIEGRFVSTIDFGKSIKHPSH